MYAINGDNILYHGDIVGHIDPWRDGQWVVRVTHNFPPAFFASRSKAEAYVRSFR